MSDQNIDQFKKNVCLHYYKNEFIPENLTQEICNKLVSNCRYEIDQFQIENYSDKPLEHIIDTDSIVFYENVSLIEKLENNYYKQNGNVEFFRAIEKSFSQNELKEIPSCPEMKKFSTIAECLSYEGFSGEDASFIQAFANSNRLNQLMLDFNTKRDEFILAQTEKTEEQKTIHTIELRKLQKQIDEYYMFNGISNIDYEKNDVLLKKLMPFANDIASSMTKSDDLTEIFLSFLPGANTNNLKSEKDTINLGNETDVILGYWWQMMAEKGKNPILYIQKYFTENKSTPSNIKDLLKQLRLQMAKEHAQDACSETSRKEQEEFNQKGGACNIMAEMRKKGMIQYSSFDDYSKLKDPPKEEINQQKILYNAFISQRICKNNIDDMGPFQINHEPEKKLRGESWQRRKKELQSELEEKKSKVAILQQEYRQSKRINFDQIDKNIEKTKDKPLIGTESIINKSPLTDKDFKPSNNGIVDSDKVFNNYTRAIQPGSNSPNRLNNFSSNSIETIESKLRSIDQQIESSRQQIKTKSSSSEAVTDETILNNLLLEKQRLQNEIEVARKAVSQPSQLIPSKTIQTDAKKEFKTLTDSRLPRSTRESDLEEPFNDQINNQDYSDHSHMAQVPNSTSFSNNSTSHPPSSNNRDSAINLLTKGLEFTQDLGQLIENPTEQDLFKLAEKTNGEPFYIQEHGTVVKIIPTKDLKGKFIFKREKLNLSQIEKLKKIINPIKEMKDISRIPTRKMDLDSAIKKAK